MNNPNYKVITHYSIEEIINKIKESNKFNFAESIDLAINLWEEKNKKKKALRNIKGLLVLPNNPNSKEVKIGVFTDEPEVALKAGAHRAGLDDLIFLIQNDGIIDCDYYITKPKFVGKIASLGKKLGPRQLMPNPSLGTITEDIIGVCKKLKNSIKYKESNNILHVKIGNVKLEDKIIRENIEFAINTIHNDHSASLSKKRFFKSIYINTSMKKNSFSLNIETI